MKRVIRYGTAVVLVASAPAAAAQVVTVTCPSPVGRTFGLPGEVEQLAGTKGYYETEDGFRDGAVELQWNTAENVAVITLRAGANDFPSKATVIFRSSEQVVFVTRHGNSEPYLYSYFPTHDLVMFSTHDTGVMGSSGGARSRAWWARCKVK